MKNTEQSLPGLLFLGSQIAVGGAQQVLLFQARWFFTRGYRVYVVFFWDREGLLEKWQKDCPVPIINLQAWSKQKRTLNIFRLLRALTRLFAIIRKEKISIIESFTHHANLLGIPIAWAAKSPLRIATHHGIIEKFPAWQGSIHSGLINHGIATKLVVVSEQVRQQAIEMEKIRPDRIVVIPNGINPNAISSLDSRGREHLRNSLAVGSQNFIVLTVGRLRIQKGHIYLLQAIPAVLEHFPYIIFLFAGDGPLRHELEKKAKELGIESSIRFLGAREDVTDLLSVADLFILPSLWEGLPIALLEAMNAGLPVVVTEVEGTSEIIRASNAGLLVPPADPDELKEALLKMISDSALRTQYSQAGKKYVQSEYTIEKMCLSYESFFMDEMRKSGER